MVIWKPEDMDNLIEVARSAGMVILDYYSGRKDFKVEKKQDDSPVTTADFAANEIICDLLPKRWNFPLISEEEPHPGITDSEAVYWLIDPLDGTREFVDGTDDFTVNIALIENGYPVVGVIYAPVFGSLYFGSSFGGSFKLLAGEKFPLPIRARHIQENGQYIVAVSRRVAEHAAKYIDDLNGDFTINSIGSSLKFCAIAEGFADFYPRRGSISGWDTAAGQCILEEAGGAVWSSDGERMKYNPTRQENPPFLAIGGGEKNWLDVFFTPPTRIAQ